MWAKEAPRSGVLGRADILECLLGPSAVLLLLGEPGIGKTTLLRCVDDRAGCPVFRIGCKYIARNARLDALLALLSRLQRSEERGKVLRQVSEREALVELTLALERATVSSGVIVQFDDLQWADEATLSALPYLCERLADHPIRWHFAARSGYERVEDVMHVLRKDAGARHIGVQPLTSEEIGAVIDAAQPDMPSEARSAIVSSARGNPLYAQLLTAAKAGTAAGISAAARNHILDLPEQALFVAASLAVIDRNVDATEIGLMTKLPENEVAKARDLLIARGVVEAAEDAFKVRHDVVSEAIRRQCPAEQLAQLHSGASELARDDIQRARHLRSADRRWEASALFEKAGARALFRDDWTLAERCFAEALALDESAVEDHSRMLFPGMRLVRRVLDCTIGPMTPDDRREGWSAYEPDVRARLELAHTDAYLQVTNSFNREDCDRIIALVDEEIHPSVRALLLCHVLRAYRYANESKGVCTALEHLQITLPLLSDSAVRCTASARIACYAALYDDWTTGTRLFEEAIARGTAAQAFDAVAGAIQSFVAIALESGHLKAGLAWGRVGLDLAGVSPSHRTTLALQFSQILGESGRLSEAMSIASAAAAMIDALPKVRHELVFAMQITLATDLGLTERAQTLIQECTGAGVRGPMTELAIGFFHECHGDLTLARAALEADFESPSRANPLNLRNALLALARIALATKDSSLMRRTLLRLRDTERSEGSDPAVQWGAAYELALAGDEARALEILRAIDRGALPPRHAARVQFEIAMFSKQADDFVKAKERFHDLGMEFMVRRIIKAAKEAGVPLPRDSNRKQRLTDREQTIALMISAGRTNVEIATALSISKRTAEHHVDHIRTKLGVRSRVEIAMYVAGGHSLA